MTSEVRQQFVRWIATLSDDECRFVSALTAAMHVRDTQPELYAVLDTHDHELAMAWLRAHGWLGDGGELGPRAMARRLHVALPGAGDHLN